ncbi:PPK2 family polyphosphate kinase [Micrococcus lacusdianchii]|uniref:PPK2 family polyphosphate kinase n=1 Tax=Micrococcus lacusdianchii TaxID=2915940 RepID=UPI0020068D63|nr:PPK2 family polyphosphate kinase [Micrococcus sp. JXJ CY 30]
MSTTKDETTPEGAGSVFDAPARRVLRARRPDGAPVGPADVDPRSTPGFTGGKAEGKAALAARADRLAALQELLYARSTREAADGAPAPSVLLVVQAMDTAGKGGIMRHVIGQMDPQGVDLTAFKAPTDEERAHDFLWRIRPHVPGPGRIAVFDRSHYEDVLIQRVRGFAPAEEIERRYGAIRDFEAELAAAGTRVVKVMLHISADEQKARLAERLARPDKHWKFNPGDIDERARWDEYQEVYRIALLRTDVTDAPWFVVPADRKWYARLAVQQLLIETLEGLELEWPEADFDVEEQQARLAAS